ncbi:hypothetical protein GCM10020000_24740 [Streptomyces olivoverticillatus]
MVAREDAEATAVLRQGGRDAEFGGEVGDGGGQVRRLFLIPPAAAEVVLQVVGSRGQAPPEAAVLGKGGQPGGGDAAQQPQRVAPGGLPPLGVDGLEQFTGLGVPGPAQIARQFAERS